MSDSADTYVVHDRISNKFGENFYNLESAFLKFSGGSLKDSDRSNLFKKTNKSSFGMYKQYLKDLDKNVCFEGSLATQCWANYFRFSPG